MCQSSSVDFEEFSSLFEEIRNRWERGRLFQFQRSWETEGKDKEQSRTADLPGARGQEGTHKRCLTKTLKT